MRFADDFTSSIGSAYAWRGECLHEAISLIEARTDPSLEPMTRDPTCHLIVQQTPPALVELKSASWDLSL
jgi:hypothetical protein